MATGLRTCRKAETSVLSMVHPGRPCLHCTLCKEKYPVYTHPIKWKNEHLYTLLRELEPNISIQPESCVCRNCRDDLLRIQHAGPTSKGARPPRWAQQDSDNNIAQSTCEIPDCSQLASTLTKLRPWAEICSILRIDAASGGDAHSTGTKLCSEHYRMLHMELNPTTYQRKCPACSRKIANRGYSRPCVEPQLFEAHLRENTDFTGNLTAEDRVCMGCYRYSLNISKLSKECPITSTDEDFNALIESIRKSLTLSPGSEIETIELAVKLTALDVAEELKANHAITLQKAFSSFKAHMEGQDKHRTPRWLLGHLSSCLKHHLAYFCTVRKHGIILYRQGRELQSLSHAVYMRGAGPTQGTGDLRAMCKDINTKIKRQIRTTSESLSTTTSFDIQQMIDSIDPDLWETICILTSSEKRKRKRKPRPTTKKRRNRVSSTHVKNIRRLFILHQIMFSIDKTCSMPFHLLNADLLDYLGGSAELIRIFNRLGLCVSLDTLSRHIQTTISTVQKDSLLQGLDPSNITVFTVDNIDYLHSYAKVFCGNQKLSYHGTTIQAVQTKQLTRQVGRRRSHALLSPAMGDMKSPIPKRVRGSVVFYNTPCLSLSWSSHSRSRGPAPLTATRSRGPAPLAATRSHSRGPAPHTTTRSRGPAPLAATRSRGPAHSHCHLLSWSSPSHCHSLSWLAPHSHSLVPLAATPLQCRPMVDLSSFLSHHWCLVIQISTLTNFYHSPQESGQFSKQLLYYNVSCFLVTLCKAGLYLYQQ